MRLSTLALFAIIGLLIYAFVQKERQARLSAADPEQVSLTGGPLNLRADTNASPGRATPARKLSPNEEAQERDRERARLAKVHGLPQVFEGSVQRHLSDVLLVVKISESEAILESYPDARMAADEQQVRFKAWRVGTRSSDSSAGKTYHRLIYAPDPLPRWDKYGRPINRNGAETREELNRSSTSLTR